MDKATQFKALNGIYNALNQLPITGAQAELITSIKQSLTAIAEAIKLELDAAAAAAAEEKKKTVKKDS